MKLLVFLLPFIVAGQPVVVHAGMTRAPEPQNNSSELRSDCSSGADTSAQGLERLRLPRLAGFVLSLAGAVQAAEADEAPAVLPQQPPALVNSEAGTERGDSDPQQSEEQQRPLTPLIAPHVALPGEAGQEVDDQLSNESEQVDDLSRNLDEPGAEMAGDVAAAQPQEPAGAEAPAQGAREEVDSTESGEDSTAAGEAEQNTWDDLWHSTTKFGLAMATLGIGVLSVMAAIRGVVKGSIEVRYWWNAMTRFSKREFTDTAACNVYSLVPDGDGLVLEGDTRDRPMLSEFFANFGARRYFLKAAKKCTHEQPLVCLEFPRDIDKREKFLRKIGRGLLHVPHYMSFKKLFPALSQPPDPNLERFAALNRINKYLRESVSAIYNKSSIGMSAKQFQKEFPLGYYEGEVVVVPICDVAPPDEKNAMTLVLATLPFSDFERFGDPEELARMRVGDSINPNRVEVFRRAYEEYKDYRQYFDQGGNPQQLFPRVRVYIPHMPEELAQPEKQPEQKFSLVKKEGTEG